MNTQDYVYFGRELEKARLRKARGFWFAPRHRHDAIVWLKRNDGYGYINWGWFGIWVWEIKPKPGTAENDKAKEVGYLLPMEDLITETWVKEKNVEIQVLTYCQKQEWHYVVWVSHKLYKMRGKFSSKEAEAAYPQPSYAHREAARNAAWNKIAEWTDNLPEIQGRRLLRKIHHHKAKGE